MSRGEEIEIRQCRREDLDQIAQLCYRTGYGGEDVAASGLFKDHLLFELLFCRYYLRHETESSFVAVRRQPPGRIAGYVLGCADTARYERLFGLCIIPRMIVRIAAYTAWHDRATVRELLRWGRNNPWQDANPAGKGFPAHLHMGVLPELQHLGVGSRLLEALEARLRERHVPGIHLLTSNYHTKAIPFYLKHGYRLLLDRSHLMWSGLSDYHSLVFVKSLAPAAEKHSLRRVRRPPTT